MRRLRIVVTVTVLSGVAAPAQAIDHKNLDENRPLRLEDAYPIANGELAVEAGPGFTLQRKSADRGVFPIEILYGALPNLHLGVGTTFSTSPRDIEDQAKSGDLGLSGLYNFNQETLALPAFAAKLTLNLPTGVESSGTDVDVVAIVTKSFERFSVHFNGGYELLTGTERGERDGVYRLNLGASYPAGAPLHTRTLIVGDVFTEQAVRRDDSNIVGVEVGLRHQLTLRIVWDVGVGTEFAGPANRSRLLLATGVSMGF